MRYYFNIFMLIIVFIFIFSVKYSGYSQEIVQIKPILMIKLTIKAIYITI